jgi:hypothetical protein
VSRNRTFTPQRLPSGRWRVRWWEHDGSRPGASFRTLAAARHHLARKQVERDEIRAGLRAPPGAEMPAPPAPSSWPLVLRIPPDIPFGEIVYFIGIVELEAIKIGTTGNLTSRMSNLRTASPVKPELLAVLEGGRDLEATMHNRFQNLRINGEWFRAAPELVEFLVALRTGGGHGA